MPAFISFTFAEYKIIILLKTWTESYLCLNNNVLLYLASEANKNVISVVL